MTQEPDERARGELPPTRPGVRSIEELRRLASSDEHRAFWDEEERTARLNRIGRPGAIVAHYSDASAILDHILPEDQLRLSAFDRMRDPRENKDWVQFGTQRRVGTASSPEAAAAMMAEPFPIDMQAAIKEANRARQRRTKVLCMAGESDERSPYEDSYRCYTRPRMWEQYADAHRGICLVFDRALLDEVLFRELSAQGQLRANEVAYDNAAVIDAGPTAFTLRAEAIATAGGDVAGAVAAHFEEHQDLLLFTKMEDYREEQEIRYAVTDDRDDQFVFTPFGDALIAVVLGEAFPDDELDRARDGCEKHNVVLRRILWSPYGALAVPLD